MILDYETMCDGLRLAGNDEMICHISAQFANSSAVNDEDRKQALIKLRSHLLKLKAEESPEKYLAICRNDDIQDYYLRTAAGYFHKADFEKYDHYIQRLTSIRSILHDSLDILTARSQTQKFIDLDFYNFRLASFEMNRDKLFPIATPEEAEKDIERWLNDTNKLDLAHIVSTILLKMSQEKLYCLELGCHAGALLKLIRDEIGNQGKVDFIGIEPDMKALQVAKTRFPDLDIRLGNHEYLDNERVDLPGRISVLILSTILLLNVPDVVKYIFSFARDNVDQLVIMDDIANFNGEYAVFRRYYLLHPFKKFFDDYNFKPIMIALPKHPNQAITGIIVAENKRG